MESTSANTTEPESSKYGLPHLTWKDTEDKCEPLGEEGYFGDCFYLKDHDLVVKKYRDIQHVHKVEEELDVLVYL